MAESNARSAQASKILETGPLVSRPSALHAVSGVNLDPNDNRTLQKLDGYDSAKSPTQIL